MATQITPEMEELERQKTYFAHQMRLHDLKLSRLKLEQNLEAVVEEIAKLETKVETLKN